MNPEVLVVVGTDHHPFVRLVTWVDAWAELHPDVRVLVQHGHAPPPAHAEGAKLLPHDQLGALFADATVIICHGGPATIADARTAGTRPLVVPRDPDHGEHVDEHQMLFAERLARRHEIDLVRSREQLHATIDAVLADPSTHRADTSAVAREVAAAVTAFGRQADAAIVASRRRRRRRVLGSRP